MNADYIGQSSGPERSGILFVDGPRVEQHTGDCLDDRRVAIPGQPGPFLGYEPGRKVWIPGQSPEAVEVSHCKVVAEPIGARSGIGHSNKSSKRPVEDATSDQLF